jgi:hypothetical protein
MTKTLTPGRDPFGTLNIRACFEIRISDFGFAAARTMVRATGVHHA